MRKFDKMFQTEERKVAIIVHNCPNYPRIENLSYVKLVFLPENITSVGKAVDRGVTRCFKSYYRKRLV